MKSNQSKWIFKVGGLALTLGAGVLIGRVSAPEGSSATASGNSPDGASEGGARLSLAERAQQRRAGDSRDATRNVDRTLGNILEATSRLERTQRLLAFLDRLPADQFSSVYEELRNSPSANLSGSERSLVLQAWAERDPLGAVAYLQTSESTNDGERETALASWAAKDPQGAFAWASSAADEGEVNNWLLGATRGIAAADPLLARDYIVQLEGRTLDRAIDAVESFVTQMGYDYTASWIAGLPDEAMRNQASREMASDLAQADPAQAARWSEAVTDPDTRRDVSQTIANRWAREDVTAARAWAERLPDDSRSAAVQGITRQYARQDPAAAAQWIAGLGNSPEYERTRQIFIEESFRSSPESSLNFVGSLQDRGQQQEYYQRYLGDWLRRDNGAAVEWINSNMNQIPRNVLNRLERQQQQ